MRLGNDKRALVKDPSGTSVFDLQVTARPPSPPAPASVCTLPPEEAAFGAGTGSRLGVGVSWEQPVLHGLQRGSRRRPCGRQGLPLAGPVWLEVWGRGGFPSRDRWELVPGHDEGPHHRSPPAQQLEAPRPWRKWPQCLPEHRSSCVLGTVLSLSQRSLPGDPRVAEPCVHEPATEASSVPRMAQRPLGPRDSEKISSPGAFSGYYQATRFRRSGIFACPSEMLLENQNQASPAPGSPHPSAVPWDCPSTAAPR
ncbi:uncharacterized protein LOC107195332 [Pteropus alecto]|uniref:uncharacterized protein LOC107195332 n=1 Tax=Pteropus alecto TaxID=9402 RepID=UPI000D53B8A7|nr:uncharacterized protein LOC107195332 [Pteropus alecto]